MFYLCNVLLTRELPETIGVEVFYIHPDDFIHEDNLIKTNYLLLFPDLDLSSSDESFHPPSRPHHRKGGGSSKVKGPSIQDGPAMFAKLLQENLNSSSGNLMELATS